MKPLAQLWLFQILLIAAATSFAQQPIHVTVHKSDRASSLANASKLGRDYWFAIPQNFQANVDPTRYFYLYISSPNNATVYAQFGNGPVLQRLVNANSFVALASSVNDFGKSIELQSSGIIENKTVHVWSPDADIAVSFLSRAPFTSDGMSSLPASGWGKDYVVAAYSAFLVDPSLADMPSEFVVVANHDSTTVTITPSFDIRQNGKPTAVAHAAGTPFTVMLMRGECVQFQSVGPVSGSVPDLTGTLVHANHPVGVMGASVCPNIPAPDASCDYVLEMLPPTQAWGQHYFSGPFAGRQYGGDAFLIIGTQPSQAIMRNGSSVYSIDTKMAPLFLYDISDASEWTSTAPFLLVQYIESSTHTAPSVSKRNSGDPAMMVLEPVEQYSTSASCIIPALGGSLGAGQPDFTNYINIFTPVANDSKVMVDGIGVNQLLGTSRVKKQIGNSTWEHIQVKFNSAGGGAGGHTITSTAEVGVSSYGYTTDDSYAWPSALGHRALFLLDTVAPDASLQASGCFGGLVQLREAGSSHSGLGAIVIDSLYNVGFNPSLNDLEVTAEDSASFSVASLDSTREAFVRLTVTDLAGNMTTIDIAIDAGAALAAHGKTNVEFVANTPDTLSLTLVNTGKLAINLSNLKLDPSGSAGFTLLDKPSSSLAAGDSIVVHVQFVSSISGAYSTTLLLDADCMHFAQLLLAGSGPVGKGFVIPCIAVGTSQIDSVKISNLGIGDKVIDSVWCTPPTSFNIVTSVTSANPITVSSGASAYISVRFTPTQTGNDSSFFTVHFTDGTTLTLLVYGCGLESGVTPEYGSGNSLAIREVSPNPAHRGQSLEFSYTLPTSGVMELQLLNALGQVVATPIMQHLEQAGEHQVRYQLPASLAAGVYYYRFVFGNEHRSGMVVIE
ncbi:MAG: T9SS type A sorting domain-containing protein [Bacteroidetes bacterium]|nr:T9SS type A sorting domain-containing protein [Bacteroidota bacterium]